MKEITDVRQLMNNVIARKLAKCAQTPNVFGPQLVAIGQNTNVERYPKVMVSSPVDLDPESEHFGELVFIVGI